MKPKRAAVLIVEDEAIIAHDISDTLIEGGYTVTDITATGEAALASAAEAPPPDVVMLDIKLAGGGMDGIECGHEMRSRYAVPSVYVTSHTDPETMARVNGDPFVSKPFTPEKLFEAVETALGHIAGG